MKDRKAGLTCCSNGLKPEKRHQIAELRDLLREYGIESIESGSMYSEIPWGHGDGKTRAASLMKFYLDESITDIFDLSGGDLSNEILQHLVFDVIRDHPKPFWGYSDLTVILNAIYAKTGREGVLYQVRNLLSDEFARRSFGSEELFSVPVRFIRGDHMEGTVVGGNIRCFLKLSGTVYFPDLTGKILLLEAFGGEAPQMITYLSQLKQLEAFKKVSGVLLGTFTKMEQTAANPPMEDLILRFIPESLPVAKTEWIGHRSNSRAISIGGHYRFDLKKL